MKNNKKRNLLLSLILAAVCLAFLLYVDKFQHYSMLATVLKKGAIYSLVAVSLNLLNGFTGLFSLGQAGFMMIGAYTYVCLPMVVGLILAGVVPTLFAWLIGLPVLKLKSDYLAIATLGFAEIMRAIIQWNKVGPLTNSSNLLRQFANFDSVLFPFIVSGICIAIIVLIINSTYGRAFKAIRDDEVAAEAMGINLAKHKMQAFLISSFFAGISGALLAMFQASIQANAFTSTMTYEILLIVVIGGIGSVTGSILGSFLYIACSEWWLRFLDDPMPYLGVNIPFMRGGFRMLVFSVIMIVVLFFRKGIMGDREFSWDAIINFFGKLFKKKDKAAKEVTSK